MNIAIIMNNIINGSNTKNHAIPGAPARHIKFNIHVQNNTYKILITKMRVVLVTEQVKLPTQYLSKLPIFWKNIIKIDIIDTTK